MKNIHLFETQDSYDAAKKGLILPTVSYIKDTKVVEYNPSVDANEHKFVEIAGIKWATMNVGANKVTDYGKYFQWGDTQGYTADKVGTGEGQKEFSDDDYNSELLTKYNTKGMTLDLDDDAVHTNWGGSWRMPTLDEFAILRDAVDTVWTDNYNNSGVAGLLCTANDGSNKTLFFPACGNAYDGAVYDTGVYGYYWLSSLDADDVSSAYSLYFGSDDADVDSRFDRGNGLCVRGVLAEN